MGAVVVCRRRYLLVGLVRMSTAVSVVVVVDRFLWSIFTNGSAAFDSVVLSDGALRRRLPNNFRFEPDVAPIFVRFRIFCTFRCAFMFLAATSISNGLDAIDDGLFIGLRLRRMSRTPFDCD